MDEIAEGKSRVWRSNRGQQEDSASGEGKQPAARKQPAETAYGRLMARRTR
jgi:hypothetical protein